MRVYFDNAATTAISEEVIEAMLPALRNLYGNPSSIHAEGRTARAALESARKTVAQYIGAGTGEIFSHPVVPKATIWQSSALCATLVFNASSAVQRNTIAERMPLKRYVQSKA